MLSDQNAWCCGPNSPLAGNSYEDSIIFLTANLVNQLFFCNLNGYEFGRKNRKVRSLFCIIKAGSEKYQHDELDLDAPFDYCIPAYLSSNTNDGVSTPH